MRMKSILAMLPFFAALAQEKKDDAYVLSNPITAGYGNMAEHMFISSSGPIFIPRRSKFKGYMRDNRNWGRKR